MISEPFSWTLHTLYWLGGLGVVIVFFIRSFLSRPGDQTVVYILEEVIPPSDVDLLGL